MEPTRHYKRDLDDCDYHHFAFDIESYEDGTPYLIVLADLETNRRYTFWKGNCVHSFVTKLLYLSSQSKHKLKYLWAHNGCGWDFCLLKKYILFPVYNGSKIVSGRIGSCELRDTMNFNPGKLDDIGKHVLKMPGKVPISLDKVLSGHNRYKDEIIEYCKRDVEILANLIIYLPKVLDETCYQFQSVAAYAYQQSIPPNIPLYGYNKSLYDVIKCAYYGARVTSCCFGQHIKRSLALYDFRSMYPAALTHELPIGKPVVQDWRDQDICTKKPFIAFCKVMKEYNPHETDIGMCPVHHNGKLHHLNHGEIHAFFSQIDIINMIQDGWKVEIGLNKVIVWPDSEPFLKDFMETNYKIKQSYPKDSIEYRRSKIFLNATYGKYGQQMFDREYSNPTVISVWCLSWTRRMWLKVKRALPIGTQIYYGDTDSFVIDSDIPVPTGTALGELDKETTSDEIIVLARKLYYMNEKKSGHKGVSSKLPRDDYIRGLKEPQYVKKLQRYVVNGELCGLIEKNVTMRVVNPTF